MTHGSKFGGLMLVVLAIAPSGCKTLGANGSGGDESTSGDTSAITVGRVLERGVDIATAKDKKQAALDAIIDLGATALTEALAGERVSAGHPLPVGSPTSGEAPAEEEIGTDETTPDEAPAPRSREPRR